MKANWQQHAPLVVLDEFLVAQEWAGLLHYTLKRGADFANSGVLGAGGASHTDDSYRRSRVLYDLGDCQTMFVDRIMTFLPHVLARLRLPPFPISHFEVQLTATNDGQFFRQHSDNDAGPLRSRTLTFVYYFFREPKAFRGGALRLHDPQLDKRGKLTPGAYQTVHPIQNQIIFFPSNCLHEVMPVECPSREFSDSRFTVNGWVHQ
jgi:Rps23 Pro-64 3,4-dihydroxylase Tpa1-like proline 4-hydroxylase